MSRERVQDKAGRYLAEARLTVTAVDGDNVRAVCRGQGELYDCGHEPGRGWWCSCPVRTTNCCHLAALQLVVVRRSA